MSKYADFWLQINQNVKFEASSVQYAYNTKGSVTKLI